MVINKKRLILGIVILLLVIIVIIGSIIIFKPSDSGNTTKNTDKSSNNNNTNTGTDNNNNSKTPVVAPTKETADALKQQAADAINNKDYTKARTLLIEAQQQYTNLGDTDSATDIDAQIYYIDHLPVPPTPPARQTGSGTQ